MPDESLIEIDVKTIIRNKIIDKASFSPEYVIMNALATVVACEGLFSNTGLSLALVDGNNKLLRKAIFAEIGGAGIVLAVAFFIGAIQHDLPLTGEILNRTRPSLLDLMIGLPSRIRRLFAFPGELCRHSAHVIADHAASRLSSNSFAKIGRRRRTDRNSRKDLRALPQCVGLPDHRSRPHLQFRKYSRHGASP